MSQSKADQLRERLGSGLADSIGVREGEAIIPLAQPVAAPPPANFTRNRAAGEIEVDQVMPDPGQPEIALVQRIPERHRHGRERDQRHHEERGRHEEPPEPGLRARKSPVRLHGPSMPQLRSEGAERAEQRRAGSRAEIGKSRERRDVPHRSG